MKRFLLPLFSLFMVMAILVNTAGITVYNHFCSNEGESSIFFIKQENCCAKEIIKTDKHGCCEKKKAATGQYAPKKGCCSQDAFTAQWKINEFSIQKNVLIAAPEVSSPFQFNIASLLSEVNHFNVEIFDPPFSFPPIEILHRYSVLLI